MGDNDRGRKRSGLRALLAVVGVAAVLWAAFDAGPTPPDAHLVMLGASVGPAMVINRVAPRIVDPIQGDVVVFRQRTDAGLVERLGRVVAVDGQELIWRDGALHVGGRALRDVSWDSSSWRPQRRKSEGLGRYFARFVEGERDETTSRPPPATGLSQAKSRVPRHRLFVLVGTNLAAARGAMVPYGDVTGVAYFPSLPAGLRD